MVLEVKANVTLSDVGDPPDEGPSSIESQQEEADKRERRCDREGCQAGPPTEAPRAARVVAVSKAVTTEPPRPGEPPRTEGGAAGEQAATRRSGLQRRWQLHPEPLG